MSVKVDFAKRYLEPDKTDLIYILHKNAKKSDLYLRTKIILLSWEGHSNNEIGQLVGLSPLTVGIWIKRFNKKGINGLLCGPS